jgi:hypothetical protein
MCKSDMELLLDMEAETASGAASESGLAVGSRSHSYRTNRGHPASSGLYCFLRCPGTAE